MVWEIAWKLKHKTVCFVFFIVVFHLQIFKAVVREECRLSQKAKQISLWLSKQNSITHKAAKRLREQHCFVKLEFIFLPIFLCMYMNSHSYVLFEKINPDIAKMLTLCCVFWCVRKSRNSQEEKNFKLSQLVDIVVVCLSYFSCYLVPNSCILIRS